MEIGSIAGIRMMPAIKSRPIDPELTALFDVESSARTGDDTYTGNGKKAAGAEENDDDEQDPDEASDDEPAQGTYIESSGSKINFFA